ncbi:MAG: CAP-associated domain-containing protein, partial [Romboutsia sp.]|uniref:CAP-associated domain-containing protein n=1 Tax=Romboutsia sp. TaxID=1965302 RepID=UPI003F3F5386
MKKIILILLVVGIFFYNGGLKQSIEKFRQEKLKDEGIETINYNTKESISDNDLKEKSYNTDINNFRNIKIGDDLNSVIKKIGEPGRVDKSEYSFDWYVYNQFNDKFAMVGIGDNVVKALYTNSINTCESGNLMLDSDNRTSVRENYEPLEYKKKGNTKYIISSNNQYDILKIDGKYITIFYDIYENNRVCAVQILNEKVEDSLDG